MPELHLWWNGYDHAPGATAEDANRWLMGESGCSAEECEGDGWVQVQDDERIHEEDEGPQPNDLTAIEYAHSLAGTYSPPPDAASSTPRGPAATPDPEDSPP